MNNTPETKNPIGRPTDYSNEMVSRVDDYITLCKASSSANLPKVEGLSLYLGINKSTLYDWARRYKEFSDALNRIKVEQYCSLVDGGLSGRYNSTITKLLLVSNHGLKDGGRNDILIPTTFLTSEERQRLDALLKESRIIDNGGEKAKTTGE